MGAIDCQKRPDRGVLCSECRTLLDRFSEAVHELVTLQQSHLNAVVRDEEDPHRFELLIHAATELKQNAKYAYIHHRESHRCSPRQDEINQG